MDKASLIAEPARLTAILDKYRDELSAIPRDQFAAVIVRRERVLALTEHLLASMSEYEPGLDQVLAPAQASRRRAEIRRLPERAQAFYAADLLAIQVYTPEQEQERRALFERVAEHDRTLLKWARPLFGDDPERAALLDDIQKGTGHQDSAEDVIRLVTLYRSEWSEAEGQTPITAAYLDRAEADATTMLQRLSGKEEAQARDLARRAYTAWQRDYREIMLLGRYLARHEPDCKVRFPGIHAARTSTRRDAGREDSGDSAGSGVGREDSGAGGEDSGAGGDDSGAGGEDSGAGGEDSGAGGEDSGAGREDSGAGGEDSGAGGAASGMASEAEAKGDMGA